MSNKKSLCGNGLIQRPTKTINTATRNEVDVVSTNKNYHRIDTLYMNERPRTVQEFNAGGFINWANFTISMPPVLGVNYARLKYFRCDNTFFLFSKGFNEFGQPNNDVTTFYIDELGVYYPVVLVGSYQHDGTVIATEISLQLSTAGSTVVCTFNPSTSQYQFISPLNTFNVDFTHYNFIGNPDVSDIATLLGFYINAPNAGGSDFHGNLIYPATFVAPQFVVNSPGVGSFYYPQIFKITLSPIPENIFDSASNSSTFVISNDSTPLGKPFLFTELDFYTQEVTNFGADVTGYRVRVQDRLDNYIDFGGQDWNMLIELESSN